MGNFNIYTSRTYYQILDVTVIKKSIDDAVTVGARVRFKCFFDEGAVLDNAGTAIIEQVNTSCSSFWLGYYRVKSWRATSGHIFPANVGRHRCWLHFHRVR